MKINPAIRDRWLAALRSGKYNQTVEALATEQGHCCLGVLCELAAEDNVVERLEGGNHYVFRGPRPDSDDECDRVVWSSDSVLPQAVLEWAEMDMDVERLPGAPLVDNINDPIVIWNGERKSLSTLNDDEGLDFNEIAAIIEKDTTPNEEVK